MRLEAVCKNCGSPISFNTFEETRADFAKNKGKLVSIKCKKCNVDAQHHINEFTAKAYGLRILAWSFAIVSYCFLVLSFFFPDTVVFVQEFLWTSKGRGTIIILFPGAIFQLIITGAHRKERAYNSYRVKH